MAAHMKGSVSTSRAPFQASSSPRAVPLLPARLQLRTGRQQTAGVVVQAENSSSNAADALAYDVAKIRPFDLSPDKETLRDVLAFAGPAPERINGRVAMWAFASVVITELSSHTPALEQLASGWFAAILFSLTISFASIAPKLVSGVSLKELHAAATTAGMQGPGLQQFVSLFDTNIELWSGRLAMLGVVGIPLLEAFVVKDSLL